MTILNSDSGSQRVDTPCVLDPDLRDDILDAFALKHVIAFVKPRVHKDSELFALGVAANADVYFGQIE